MIEDGILDFNQDKRGETSYSISFWLWVKVFSVDGGFVCSLSLVT